MFRIARRAALAQQCSPYSCKAASKSFSTRAQLMQRLRDRRGTVVLSALGVVGSAAMITMPARSERRDLGLPVPKNMISKANVSLNFQQTSTPAKAEAIALEVGFYAYLIHTWVFRLQKALHATIAACSYCTSKFSCLLCSTVPMGIAVLLTLNIT
jgi:hypothetical protein